MVKIDPGKLDQLVSIMAPVYSPDSPNAYGEEPDKGRRVAEDVWASVDALSGREVLPAAQVVADVTHKVVMWFREGLTTDCWLEHEGRRLDILFIRDVESAGVKLELLCQEKVIEAT